MGASGKKTIKSSDYIPALLISLTKIKEFREYFTSKKDFGKLSKIFKSLIDDNLLDGIVLEFNKFMNQYNTNSKKLLDINNIILFILNKLHEETNELKNDSNNDNDDNDTSLLDINNPNYNEDSIYNEFLKYYSYNKSCIQDLFFREDESISICSKCKKTFYNFNIEKQLHFDIINYKKNDELELLDLIKEKQEKFIQKNFCINCKQKNDILNIINFKKLPEIFIISFDNISKYHTINYYLNLNISNEAYVLICIIINKNELNEDVTNYNVFYKNNKKWLIYDTNNKETRNVENIKLISQNPLVCYYQKKITYVNIFINDLYDKLKSLFSELNVLQEKIKKHISNAKNWEKYYIINKKWFNKLIKIFENDDAYNDDNFVIENFDSINNVNNMNINQKKKLDELFIHRIKILENENLFIPEFDINQETRIKYPQNFVLIPEKYLNEFLQEFDIDININSISKYLYDILIGENYLFIKDNENINTYFVGYNLLFLINIEKIFIFYNEKYFEKEINKYIKDKGLINYYEERNIDEYQPIQNIYDKEQEKIGQFISLINNGTMIQLNKFFLNKNMHS